MTGIWLNLSGKIDPSTLRLLDQLGVILRANDAPFAIIGATARDLIFQFGFDIPVTRSTADVDCAVLLPDWTKFDQIKTALIATGNFRAGKNPQRVHWVETNR